ncbi:MAG: diaminopimelate decarboxylase [Salibacteraceae bacterium]
MIGKTQIEVFKERKTPFYHYDIGHLKQVVSDAKTAADRYGYHIHYALKANTESTVLRTMIELGLGADCVSGAEILCAVKAGFDPSNIAFAGVGKTDEELMSAIDLNIFTINVESLEELKVIDHLAEIRGRNVQIALRLNPDVDADTHRYITTGLEENKFGISSWQIPEVMAFIKNSRFIDLIGLHFHIGSQIKSLEPFKNLCARVNTLNQQFLDAGFHIEHINAGGGLGIDYDQPDDIKNPDFEAFFEVFNKYLSLEANQSLHFELGRSLVANCGDLISRVLYVKKGLKTNFVILDAGMTELIRPALYQSVHKIENLSSREGNATFKYDIVGPVCESSDCFGKAMSLPETQRGDLIAIRSAGAYGASMASNYNLRKLNDPLISS